jgi:mRNA interferase RelE/StbE
MGTWNVELDKAAERDLDKLDPPVSRRIERFLHERIARLDDPRSVGEALHGDKFGELWKYRVGDYRVICKIEDKILRVLVVRIGHRRQVYERDPFSARSTAVTRHFGALVLTTPSGAAVQAHHLPSMAPAR